jgi:hypothetical protein
MKTICYIKSLYNGVKIILQQKDFPCTTKISSELSENNSKNNIQTGNGFPKNRKKVRARSKISW